MNSLRLASSIALTGSLLTVAQWLTPEVPDARRTLRGRAVDGAFIGQYLLVTPMIGLGIRTISVECHGLIGSIHVWPIAAQIVAGLGALDVSSYWLHRAAHSYPIMWRFHRVHHRTDEVGWPTSFRFHVAEMAVAHGVPYVLLAALGVGDAALVIVAVVHFVVAIFAHANLDMQLRWIFPIVATPRYHRTHHERDRGGSNFALIFPLTDILFGTADFEWRTTRTFGPPPTTPTIPDGENLSLVPFDVGAPD